MSNPQNASLALFGNPLFSFLKSGSPRAPGLFSTSSPETWSGKASRCLLQTSTAFSQLRRRPETAGHGAVRELGVELSHRPWTFTGALCCLRFVSRGSFAEISTHHPSPPLPWPHAGYTVVGDRAVVLPQYPRPSRSHSSNAAGQREAVDGSGADNHRLDQDR